MKNVKYFHVFVIDGTNNLRYFHWFVLLHCLYYAFYLNNTYIESHIQYFNASGYDELFHCKGLILHWVLTSGIYKSSILCYFEKLKGSFLQHILRMIETYTI